MTDKNIPHSVDDYLEGLLLSDDAILKETLARQDEAGLPPMAVSPLQGAFLHIMAKSVGAKRILELGTFAGYSTIWLARALPEGGKVITLEHQIVNAELSQKNFEAAGVSHLIEIKRNKAERAMNIMISHLR